jgi:heptaprenylglyceryl phosphate synthase
LRRGQRTEAKHKDRSAKHVFKIDPASTEFHPISAAQRIQESPTQPGCPLPRGGGRP